MSKDEKLEDVKSSYTSNTEKEFIAVWVHPTEIKVDIKMKREGLSRIFGEYKRTIITMRTNRGIQNDVAFEIKWWLKQKGYLKNE